MSNFYSTLLFVVCSMLVGTTRIQAQHDPASRTTSPLYIQSVDNLDPVIQSLFPSSCGEISNVKPIGNPLGRGFFQSDLLPFGNSAGLVFSSGQVEAIDDSILGQIPITGYLNSPGDEDLAILTNYDVVDASGFEFDFIVFSDTIEMVYQFASEEYPEYNCTPWVDVLGIFLSGPGIDGPFSDQAVNMATLDIGGVDIPVGINSINDGHLGVIFNADSSHCQSPFGALDLSGLYVANPDETEHAMNGLTKPLVARYPVTAGQTYHIKVVIADGVDDVFDSAVFLHASSLCGNPTLHPVAEAQITRINLDSVYFKNQSKFEQSYTWDFGDGTITHEKDPQVHVYPGEGIYAGFLAVENTCCVDTFFFTVPIFQAPALQSASVRPFTCQTPGMIHLDILSSTSYFCIWSHGEFTYDPFVQGLSPGQYSVEITNTMGQKSTFGPFVIDSIANGFQGVLDTVLYPTCSDPATGIIVIVPPGEEADYTYQWSHNPALDIWVADELAAGLYHVTVSDLDGCRQSLSILLEDTGPIIDPLITTPPLCAGGKTGSVEFEVTGQTPPFTTDVLNQTTAKLKFPPYKLDAGQYRVFVQDGKGCKTTRSFIIVDPQAMQIEFLIGLDGDGQPTVLIPKVSQGKPPYTFLWSDGNTDPTRTDLSPGTYQVTVTDDKGCTQIREFKFGIPGGGVIGNNGLQIDPVPGGVILRTDRIQNMTIRQVRLIDLLGRDLSSHSLHPESGPVFIELPIPGAYFMEFVNEQGDVWTQQIITH